ncbi:hypothetical protein [Streptomyces misionensis]|uniref:hypothetical protein n=1 Tax=Streptomyces misionensis TaxID=67331 RepID=UPI0033E9C737
MKTRDDVARAAGRMSDLVALMLEAGAAGWLAVGIEDGQCDGKVYFTREHAAADQTVPCTYVRIPEVRWGEFFDCPLQFGECADYLRFADALRDVAPGRTPVVLAEAGGVIGAPDVKWGTEFCKVTRRPGKRPHRSMVDSVEMWRHLALCLPGGECVASTDGRSIYLSVRESNQTLAEVSWTPTGRLAPGYEARN